VVVGPVRARLQPQSADINPSRLNGRRSASEIVVRIKERIIARQLNEPRYLREYRRGGRRQQDQGCAE